MTPAPEKPSLVLHDDEETNNPATLKNVAGLFVSTLNR
jgi:hypothetical protein